MKTSSKRQAKPAAEPVIAHLITVDHPFPIPKVVVYSVQDLLRIIGGSVEFIRLPSGAILAVDEEGRLKDLPFNLGASEIAKMGIVGTAVLLPPHKSLPWE